MRKYQQYASVALCFSLLLQGCAPNLPFTLSDKRVSIPHDYPKFEDGVQIGERDKNKDKVKIKDAKQKNIISSANGAWQDFFTDPHLRTLIGVALQNNQELNILEQEINVSQNEIMARQGGYLPNLALGAGAGIEKVGKYTSQGMADELTGTPERLRNKQIGLFSSWEVDIWKRLRNAAKSAYYNYLASREGKNFAITQLVAEIADHYYELIALDRQLEIVNRYIDTLQQALDVVKLQMESARATSLAVKRFEAEVLKNQSRKYKLQQQIIVTENMLNRLLGRFPQPIIRDKAMLVAPFAQNTKISVPAKLLDNRPDVKQAALKLKAAKLDVKSARARFYPALSIDAGVGYESFRTKHFFNTPESLFYNAAANLTAPILNRMAIKADYFSANNKQIQSIYHYELAIIDAYAEVANQLATIDNLKTINELKSKQVDALTESVDISNMLFRAARIDYLESLLTQRDSLKAQIELVEVQKQQLIAYVNLYKALGGGWRTETKAAKVE
jgi:multidrug efflux system outer membrane protein